MNVKSINPKTLKSWLDAGEALVVDVRELREYESGHIEGSTLIPLNSLHPGALPDPKGRKLVMLCRVGNRSMFACMKLNGAVSAEIYNLDGGIRGWTMEGFPVCKPERSSGAEDGAPLGAKFMRFMTRFS
jgi:rhodanese-related sulfurtransferase